MLPITSTCVKSCDEQTKWMFFWIKDNDLLETYNTIWDKVSVDIKREFDSKPLYSKEYLKKKNLAVISYRFLRERNFKGRLSSYLFSGN